MGHGEWGMGMRRIITLSTVNSQHLQCPMPNAQCPMPNALRPLIKSIPLLVRSS
ncbi:histidine kinase [Nostoc linckia]|nr:histidine kinase [Nostoc linckia]